MIQIIGYVTMKTEGMKQKKKVVNCHIYLFFL